MMNWRQPASHGRALALAVALLLAAPGCGDGEGDKTTDGPGGGDAVDSGGASSGATDSGASSGATDSGASSSGADVVQDSGASSGATDTGASSGATDTGASSGATDTGASSGATDAGASSGATDTGASTSSSSSGADAGSGPPDSGGGPIVIDKYSEHSASCSKDADCAIPCGKGQCSAGKCAFIPYEKTCLVDVGGGKVGCYGEGMAGAKTKCLRCNPAVSQEALTSVASLLGLDDDTDGIKTEDLSKGGMLWTLSTARSVSGGSALYFGDPKSKVYANDKHVKASATTPQLQVPKFDGVEAELSFWLWLSTEQTKGYDFLQVEVIDGGKAEQAWHSDQIGGTTHGIWKAISIKAGKWAGKKVQLRFTFDSIDSFVNAFEGAYIDDISVRTGCCGTTSDCNDGNACTTDTCAAPAGGKHPVCGHALTKQCCNSAADCDDGKPCTLDICSGKGGKCSHSAKPGCCMKAADCDDKDSCTIDHCPKAGAQCQHTNTCCKGDGECVSEDPCLVGACSAGECAYSSICCNADADCDDFNNCTLDACGADSKCVHNPSNAPGCCSPVPWAADFETDIKGWKPDPKKNNFVWHHEKPKDKNKVKSGSGVLKFGQPGKTYTGVTGTSNWGYALSPIIELPANQNATLKVDVLIDSSGSSSYNRAQFYTFYGGKSYYLGYVNNTTKGWTTFTKDISYFAGAKFQLRVYGRIGGFGSLTASGSGLYVDNLRIQTGCQPKQCTADSQCKSPSISTCRQGFCTNGVCQYADACCAGGKKCETYSKCTIGTCTGTYCSYKENKQCCDGDKDCDDGNPCTIDKCPGPGQLCKHDKKSDCCVADAECDDGDKCTADACKQNKCNNTNICCKKDGDCSDGESKCTIDTCGADNFCKHTPTGAKGCCEPDVWSNDFDSSATKGMTFKNSAGATKGWQLWSPAFVSKSGKGVLYYGNKATQNYNFGKSTGTAITPDIKVPATTDSALTWDSWLDTESSTTYDAVRVYIHNGGTKKLIYQKSVSQPKFKSKTWQSHNHSLGAYKGKTIKVEFNFDSKDGVANSGKGVFIDNLKITTKCPK